MKPEKEIISANRVHITDSETKAQEFVQNEKQMKFTKTLLYKGPHHGITLICLVRELSPIIITSYLLAFSTCSTARKNSSSNSICSFSME
jgi:hypothetical protein